ncbi:MAG: hypothetical protein QOK15_1675 [Nocardioidaceae bacterium]|nr:hypothetical protein [Nocardioidaceae bacterium]
MFPYLDPVTDREDLLHRLRAAAAGSPYVVEEPPQGFDGLVVAGVTVALLVIVGLVALVIALIG